MIQSFRITSASVSDRGLSEGRPQNEDAFLAMPQRGIFAVADGVGGAQAGEVASQMAMEILGEAFVNVDERTDAEDVMRRALVQANSAIHQMSNELPQLSQMATTVVALHLSGNIATIAHAGDSRLYRMDENGELHRETEDHSMVADEVRAGRMTEEQAENHPGKNIINRALGAEPDVDIELKTIMVGTKTTFLMCSDGVTRHVSDTEIAELLRSKNDPEFICQQIKAMCFERGAEDNLTAVVARLGEPEGAHTYEVHDVAIVPDEEITVASAREPVNAAVTVALDEDDLLELDIPIEPEHVSVVAEPTPSVSGFATSPAAVTATPIDAGDTEPVVGYFDAADQETVETTTAELSPPANADPIATQEETPARQEPEFAMFGNAGQPVVDDVRRPSSVGRIITSAVLLIIGGVIGLAAYHYLFTDRTQPAEQKPLTQMESNNQPQTAFEENRRTLDKEPEAALKRFEQAPKDAEDFFLVGRANLLLGKYPEAQKAFEVSLAKIASNEVDSTNATTLKTEIAIAMSIINDPAAQANLKKSLTETAPAANANVPTANKPPK